MEHLDKEIQMAVADKFHASVEAWESGKLGRELKHAKRASQAAEKALEDAFEMHMISIRLQKKLIDDLKFTAKPHGIGYQPLIRQLLTRFVVSEFKLMLRDAMAEAKLRETKLPVAKPKVRKVA